MNDVSNRYGSPGAQTLRVATTYIHHNHNSQTLDNDIALLKLEGQAELKPGVCIICLPSRGSVPATGRRCSVTGYGYMGESEIYSPKSNRPLELCFLNVRMSQVKSLIVSNVVKESKQISLKRKD